MRTPDREVAGLEPEKTNAFLVKLYDAATTKLDASPDAVRAERPWWRASRRACGGTGVERPNQCNVFVRATRASR